MNSIPAKCSCKSRSCPFAALICIRPRLVSLNPHPAFLGHEAVGHVVRSLRESVRYGQRETWTLADVAIIEIPAPAGICSRKANTFLVSTMLRPAMTKDSTADKPATSCFARAYRSRPFRSLCPLCHRERARNAASPAKSLLFKAVACLGYVPVCVKSSAHTLARGGSRLPGPARRNNTAGEPQTRSHR